jgi:hypothetical protein
MQYKQGGECENDKMETSQKTRRTTKSVNNRKRKQGHEERVLPQPMDHDTPRKRFLLKRTRTTQTTS